MLLMKSCKEDKTECSLCGNDCESVSHVLEQCIIIIYIYIIYIVLQLVL